MVKKAKQKENAMRKKAAAKKPVVSSATVNKPVKKSAIFDKVYKEPKKFSWQKALYYLKKRPALAFLIVFLVLGGGFVAFNQYQIYQEKKDFEQAEIVLDELASAISAELGQPLKTEKEKSCDYANRKYDDKFGAASCSVTVNLYYSENTQELDSVFNVLSENEPLNNIRKSDYYGVDAYNFSIEDIGLNCNAGITDATYPQKRDLLYLSCFKKSKAEHFPVN